MISKLVNVTDIQKKSTVYLHWKFLISSLSAYKLGLMKNSCASLITRYVTAYHGKSSSDSAELSISSVLAISSPSDPVRVNLGIVFFSLSLQIKKTNITVN